MACIETSAEKIWRSIDKHFKPGFFFDVIEQEFGITPSTHVKIIQKFDGKLDEFIEDCNLKIDKLAEQCNNEINRYQSLNRLKDQETAQRRIEMVYDYDRQKKIAEEVIEMKYSKLLEDEQTKNQ